MTYTTTDAIPRKVTVGDDGDIIGTVVQIDEGPSDYGPSWRFFVVDKTGTLVTFTENKPRVDKQLEHLKMKGVEEMLLQGLRFWKKPTPKEPGKGYLNIDRIIGPKPTTTPALASSTETASNGSGDVESRRCDAQAAWAAHFGFILNYIAVRIGESRIGEITVDFHGLALAVDSLMRAEAGR